MHKVRIILAAAFLLGGIALAVVTWLMFNSPTKRPLLLVGNFEIFHWMVMAVLTLILLAVAIKAFPGRQRGKAPAAAADSPWPAAAGSSSPLAPAPEAGGAAQPEQAPPAQPEAAAAEQPKPAPAAGAGEDEDEEGMSLEIKEKMKRLVNLEQKTITNDIARELVIEYYPELAEIIYRINDPKSLETFTRHIIGIARIRLKLSDKQLADDQFSIFQRRLFDAENQEVLKMYAPADQARMNDAQKPFYGKAVDERHWEKLQRTLRGEGDDWRGISVKNAKDLIFKTGKRQ